MVLPILCFDLDGTLLDPHGRIHPSDLDLLANPGTPALFIPATGRSLESVRRTFNRNGLFVRQRITFPMILQNGSILIEGGEHLVAYYPFESHIQEALIALANNFPQVTFLFLGLEEIHLLHPSSFGITESQRFEFEVHPMHPGSYTPFSKLMCLSKKLEHLAEVRLAFEELQVELALSMPTSLEITPQGVNKGKGLVVLREKLGLNFSPIYVAGDGENDLPLLSLADYSFTPDTAPEDIKEKVSEILEVRENGLLKPMLQRALKEK